MEFRDTDALIDFATRRVVPRAHPLFYDAKQSGWVRYLEKADAFDPEKSKETSYIVRMAYYGAVDFFRDLSPRTRTQAWDAKKLHSVQKKAATKLTESELAQRTGLSEFRVRLARESLGYDGKYELDDNHATTEPVQEQEVWNSYIRRVACELPVQMKRVIQICFWEDESLDFAAHELGLHRGTVHALKDQSLLLLKNWLNQAVYE